jgi:hypothetical protein
MTTADPARRRARRLAAGVWLLVAVVLWNGLYDFRMSFGVRDYLMHAALHELGRGPFLELSEMMAFTVRKSVQFATFWSALVLAAGLATLALLERAHGQRPQ